MGQTAWNLNRYRKWLAGAVWAVAGLVMHGLDHGGDLANLALVLVFAAALCGLWLSAWESAAVCAAAVMAFNWQFVPPRGTFSVDLRQHTLLLVVMWGVGCMVAWITAQQRALASKAQRMAEQAQLLQHFAEQLRTQTPHGIAEALAHALQRATGSSCYLALKGHVAGTPWDGVVGTASPEEKAHVEECLRLGQGTLVTLADAQGSQIATLPLHGNSGCLGAALVRNPTNWADDDDSLTTAQALCNQAALYWERSEAEALSQQAQQEAQEQKVRNTLLAAISHDYRTPLATILGAASSLLKQSDKINSVQARTMAQTIVDEVELLRSMTDNTLELSRLDAKGVHIHLDWESMEELVGSAVRQARMRHPAARIHTRMAADLPLLRCDATLVVQLLNNLVDNAVKYGSPDQALEIVARSMPPHMLLAVADRGPGIPANLRERVFQAFERGPSLATASGPARGAGLSLALCRAIMRAHAGEIHPRARRRGGTSMECLFPLQAQPAAPVLEKDAPCP